MKALRMATVLFLLILSGCAHVQPPPVVIRVPVTKPCISEDIRLSPLPIEDVKALEVQEWIKNGEFDKIRNIIFSSYIVLNEDVKALRTLIDACR